MDVFGIRVPFEVDQVLHHFRVENFVLLYVSEHVHQLVILFSHFRKQVQGVFDLKYFLGDILPCNFLELFILGEIFEYFIIIKP